jgi:hypothetical protein
MWNKPGCVDTCPNFRKSALRRALDRTMRIYAVDVPHSEASWADNAEEKRGKGRPALRRPARAAGWISFS